MESEPATGFPITDRHVKIAVPAVRGALALGIITSEEVSTVRDATGTFIWLESIAERMRAAIELGLDIADTQQVQASIDAYRDFHRSLQH